MTRPAPPIPSFALYGEPEADLASLLHIETIAARSELHDWEIGTHRHRHSVQILIVEQGEVRASIDEREETMQAPLFLCIPQATVHGFVFDPQTRGYVITLSVDFLTRLSDPEDPLLTLLTEGGRGLLPDECRERLSWLTAELLEEMQRWPRDERFLANIFEALLRSLPMPQGLGALDPRLALFRQLVERHMTEHRPVEFYTEATGLSLRSLARLCSRQLGCSPRQAINRRLAAEADRMLRHTNASVVQVSDALGFKDASYFSRFFKREAGQRPSEIKRGVLTGQA